MKYKYITKVQETLILSRSYHKNISISVHICKINVLFFAMQKSSEIKLWVTGKFESSEVETNSLSSKWLRLTFFVRCSSSRFVLRINADNVPADRFTDPDHFERSGCLTLCGPSFHVESAPLKNNYAKFFIAPVLKQVGTGQLQYFILYEFFL